MIHPSGNGERAPAASLTGLAAGLARAARVVEATGALVTHVLDHVDRLVSALAIDSTEVARESEALYGDTIAAAQSVREAVRAAPRFGRILAEVVRLAAAYRLQRARAGLVSPARAEALLRALHATHAERLYALCVELRGGVLKIGQLASARADLLPPEYVASLARLQDRVPAIAVAAIRARVEEELAGPLADHFASFDEEPIAAASLAQVHGATLADGTRLAVKVQVPGIEEVVEIDLAALRVLSTVLGDLLPGLDLPTIAAELSRSVRGELDYRREASAMAEFAERFADHGDVRVPRALPALSSERLLVMERIDGERLTDFLDGCERRGDDGARDRDRLFEILIGCFATQILEHGVFHADPHPGNFLVTRGPAGPALVLLDFGSVQLYPSEVRRAYACLAGATLGRNAPALAEQFRILGFRTRSGEPDSLAHFAEIFLELFRDGASADLRAIDPRAHVERALAAVRANPIVEIPGHFVQLGRVFATLAGLLLRYAPRVNLFALLAPALQKGLAIA